MKVIKKDELLWLYELGERNFRRRNLRGRSFKGKDLSGADFSGSDIRGADFSQAILKGATFTNVTAGLRKRQAAILLGILMLLAVVFGTVAGSVSSLMGLQLDTLGVGDAVRWLTPIMVAAFSIVSLNRGMAAGFTVFVFAFFASGLVAFTSSSAMSLAGNLATAIAVNSLITAATAAAGTLLIAAILAFGFSMAIMIALTFTVAFGCSLGIAESISPSGMSGSAIVVVTCVMMLSAYIGWRTMRGDRQRSLTWRAAKALAARWGTSFRGANLTMVDFTRAALRSTDFSEAIIKETRWDPDFPWHEWTSDL
ncbi:MAG: hypothetical protein HC769_14560 [Cyanobacteria bacterium CRU_2_1]|nr:hypothetical protein [Cyanobacteria bacterium RU_5_0]NJR59946.1 hypothetical protein [Cyanobacteria bacterium CRU_2_1]